MGEGKASEAHYAAERAEHLRNADEELAAALGDGLVANGLLPPVLNKQIVTAVDEDSGTEFSMVLVGEVVKEVEGGVGEDIGMLDGVPQRRPGSVTGYYTQAEVDEIAGKERKLELAVDPDRFLGELDEKRVEDARSLLLPVLNKADSDLVDAVFNARIEALAALRRFTSAEASGNARELSALLAADERLEEAERALKEAG